MLRRKQSRPAHAEKSGTALPIESKPTLKGPESIRNSWNCPEEKVVQAISQNSYLALPTQSYMGTPDGSSQELFVAPSLCHSYLRPASTSIENVYNDTEADCWKKCPGDSEEGEMGPVASSGFDRPPILSALLRQMRNQANLPRFFWLDNYFPLSDPLWDGILTFEQSLQPVQIGDPSSYRPENQELAQPYTGPPGNDPVAYTGGGGTIWHALQ